MINSGCASVIVDPDGKITFFNEVFRSLLRDRLHFQAIPWNIFNVFEDSPSDLRQLKNLIQEALKFQNKANNHNNRPEYHKAIELRIPRKIQPEVNRLDSKNSAPQVQKSNNS